MWYNISMETIFDHNPTNQELEDLFGYSDISKDELPENPDILNAELYRLYSIRGQEVKANSFRDRINDQKYKFSVGYDDLMD